MKRLFTLVLLSVIFTNFSLAQKKSVVDYFRLLPDSLNNGYELFYKNGKWFTVSIDTIYPTVDIRNGFIEIKDEGTGDGELRTQVVLYRKIDGSALIGVSLSEFNGFAPPGKLYFLEMHYGKWEIVTNKVFPQISIHNFMKPGYKIPESIEGNYWWRIYYNLPRYGTNIQVEIDTTTMHYECNSENKKTACDFLNNITRNPVILKWDKPNTRFVIDDK